MMNILLYKYIYFYYKVYKYSFKLLREKRQIFKEQVKQCEAQTWNENRKGWTEKMHCSFFKKKRVYCFFPVNTEYMMSISCNL